MRAAASPSPKPGSAPTPAGFASALSFGPSRPAPGARPAPPRVPAAPDVEEEPAAPTSIASLDDLRRVRAEAAAAAALAEAAPAPGRRRPCPARSPVTRSRHAATGDVPVPRRARHRSADEESDGSRRHRAEPPSGRHASGEVPVAPRRAATGR